jgi:hypothetical protein
VEVRPCEGNALTGDPLIASTSKRDGFFTVRKCLPGETPLGVAVTNAHALGFVAMQRVGAVIVRDEDVVLIRPARERVETLRDHGEA